MYTFKPAGVRAWKIEKKTRESKMEVGVELFGTLAYGHRQFLNLKSINQYIWDSIFTRRRSSTHQNLYLSLTRVLEATTCLATVESARQFAAIGFTNKEEWSDARFCQWTTSWRPKICSGNWRNPLLSPTSWFGLSQEIFWYLQTPWFE